MKNNIRIYVAVGILAFALGLLWLAAGRSNGPGAGNPRVFAAVINRDCAPWDGAAFTVSISYDPMVTVTISIWQSPDIKYPATFRFPDQTGRAGQAYYLPEPDALEPLTGTVTFDRVEQGLPVEGQFNLTAGRGRPFKGNFTAEWGNGIVYCG
jgi:hypothetical protein